MSMFPSTFYIAEIYAVVTGDTPYVALYTTNPTKADTGTEVTGGSYARQAVTFGSIVNGSVSNSAAVVFSGLPTATVTHFAIKSAASAGNMRLFGALSSSTAVVSGDQITFPVGNLQISLAGS